MNDKVLSGLVVVEDKTFELEEDTTAIVTEERREKLEVNVNEEILFKVALWELDDVRTGVAEIEAKKLELFCVEEGVTTELIILEFWSWENDFIAVGIDDELVEKIEPEKRVLVVEVVVKMFLVLDSAAIVWPLDIEELVNKDFADIEEVDNVEWITSVSWFVDE